MGIIQQHAVVNHPSLGGHKVGRGFALVTHQALTRINQGNDVVQVEHTPDLLTHWCAT